MEMFRVLDPGPYTTVQDAGRYGFQRFGIPVSGALDRFSSRVANWLVGNCEDAALLEMTFLGPRLEVLSDGMVAAAGAAMTMSLNGRFQPMWESFEVRRGDSIGFKAAREGVRAYLAVRGGILVPEVMGSRSTYVAAGIGGINGRALIKGDVLCACPSDLMPAGASLPDELRPRFSNRTTLRAMPGPQDDFFGEGMEIFFGSDYLVSSKADRMGYRLEGPAIPFNEGVPESIISEPSLPGIVQVPADGLPIIVLVEQTVGGYAKIATVISSDLDPVAQARPGDVIRFSRCDLAQAHEAYRSYGERIEMVKGILGARKTGARGISKGVQSE